MKKTLKSLVKTSITNQNQTAFFYLHQQFLLKSFIDRIPLKQDLVPQRLFYRFNMSLRTVTSYHNMLMIFSYTNIIIKLFH